ncbi:uncharacterized protein LOC129593158 [Paramacrobiotus metropolitanus]|uniref:uncharacterized protein LOC129593158 n=1 Tax=Paramacrobiotus metropolitanus TaxID=2943436 RepID=UPI002445DCD8|nr:uncharacterized protein LOC129593158 [Paramacrobiotus metropolitanus]
MSAHLSDFNRQSSLGNDIMFADASTGWGANTTSGNQTLVLWSNGKVPYQISELFASQDKFIIQQAILGIERKTLHCLTFTPRNTERNYIHFKPGNNCSSYVGFHGGIQPVFLDPNECIKIGIIQHEILHALGLFHEHSRSDRNASVIIYESGILENHISQYRIIPNMPTFGTEYDVESLMHYGPFEFAKSSDHPVIIPRQQGMYRMGQREGLSVRDAAKLRNAYKCQVRQDYQQTGEEEQLFPGFSYTPVKAEQCALQFSRYCRNPFVTRENCTQNRILEITCDISATDTDIRLVTTALGEPPLRPITVQLTEQQVTTQALFPVERLVISLVIQPCSAHDPTAQLPRFSFVNLQQLELVNCWDLRIRKADFQLLPKLKFIRFMMTTILYLEEGTFTNLLELQAIAWHENLSKSFPVSSADSFSYSGTDHLAAVRMRSYLKRIHCDCEYKWLRKWLKDKNMLKGSPANSDYFYNVVNGGNIEIELNDVYIPTDCAVTSFPADLSMININ